MDTILNSSGLKITGREIVYEAAQDVFYSCLHKCEEGQAGRDFLKAIGIGSEEARDLGLGFSFSRLSGKSQVFWIIDKSKSNIESLASCGLVRFVESDSLPLKHYHFFRDCITRPVRLTPEYADALKQDVIRIVGIPIQKPERGGVVLHTPLWSDDRGMSNYEEIMDWAFTKVRPECATVEKP